MQGIFPREELMPWLLKRKDLCNCFGPVLRNLSFKFLRVDEISHNLPRSILNHVSLSFHWTYFSVIDSSTGKPAEGVSIALQQLETAELGIDIFRPLAEGFDPGTYILIYVKLIDGIQRNE
jgi:hypothetical protein